MPKWFKLMQCCKCNNETKQENKHKEVKYCISVLKSGERSIYSTEVSILEIPATGLSDNLFTFE